MNKRIFWPGIVEVAKAATASGLMDALNGRPATAAALAARLQLDERATSLVLNVLSDAGLCVHVESPTGARYRAAAPTLDDHVFAHVHAFLKDGTGVLNLDDPRTRRESYGGVVDVLGDRFAPAATAFAAALPPRRTVLDVGAGSAVWSLAMAARSPDTRVLALDLAEVTPRSLARARALSLQERLTVIDGDYHQALCDEPVDRVVLANVLHLEAPDAAAALLQRAAAVLAADGDVVIIDCLEGESADEALFASLYALHLGMRTEKGRVHSSSALRAFCAEAGLDRVERLPEQRWAPLGALVARRSSQTGAIEGVLS